MSNSLLFLDYSRRRRSDEEAPSGGSTSSAVHVDFTRSSLTSSASAAGVCDDAEPDLELAVGLLCSTDHPSFVFCKRLSVVRDCLFEHGVETSGLGDDECEEALVCHLLNGLCARSVCFRENVPQACKTIAGNSTSCLDLSVLIMSGFLEAVGEVSFKMQWLGVVCSSLGIQAANDRRKGRKKLVATLNALALHRKAAAISSSLSFLLENISSCRKGSLVALASAHGVKTAKNMDKDAIKLAVIKHIGQGLCCSLPSPDIRDVCYRVYSQVPDCEDPYEFQIAVLSRLSVRASKADLRRLLEISGVEFSKLDGVSKLRSTLAKHIKRLKKGKLFRNGAGVVRSSARLERERQLQSVRESWPSKVKPEVKDKIRRLFMDATSSSALRQFTCAACGESCNNKECKDVPLSDCNWQVLARSSATISKSWLDADCVPPPMPFSDGPLANVLLDPAGVRGYFGADSSGISLLLCKVCDRSLKKCKVPPLSYANNTFLGTVPEELKNLTVVEEAMIARCRAKCWVVQLKEENQALKIASSQRGLRGHVIIFPQRPENLATLLPPPVEDIVTPICVVFVGASPPSPQWLQEKAAPLVVRREVVRSALIWLKKHNPLYKDVEINHSMLDSLHEKQVLPFHVEHVLPSAAQESLTSRYDGADGSEELPLEPASDSSQEFFHNVVVTDVDAKASPDELRAAAVRHMKQKGGAFIQYPHDPEPVNEFFNPDLFPMLYPTLFPYGIGGFEHGERPSALSMKRQAKHFFSLSDRRFQEHYSFMFTVFNILQRREILLRTSLKTKRQDFDSVAASFGSVSSEAVHLVAERVARGDTQTCNSDEERKVLRLMKEVRAITSSVPGSASSKVKMRNEIRGMILELGLPSFFITINPADVYNPIVKFLAGGQVDLDDLMHDQVPNYWEQSVLVARNPVVAARFFNLYLKAFIRTVLGFDPSSCPNLSEGILGVVKGYYGCVEAQGRGTLHCHMLVWVEGGLNPDEIKRRLGDDLGGDFGRRLLEYLEDTIASSIPDDVEPSVPVPSSNFHPCAVRALDPSKFDESVVASARQKDLHNLAKQCQQHRHSDTCFKYWRGGSDPKECRFGLDSSNVVPESYIDPESKEVFLRCLDGMVNNFNPTILETLRCNMDIKFIGSGVAAKGILYYITDYITKTQLQTHVSYAALDTAINKLKTFDPREDALEIRAKKLLQKCAYRMVSHQELSSQQVCSYLLDFEDHFTSHAYRNLYWPSFERYSVSVDPDAGSQDDASDPSAEMQGEDDGDGCAPLQAFDDLSGGDDDDDRSVGPCSDVADDYYVGVNDSGNFVARASQFSDYLLRGDAFSDVSLWDFVSRVDKVRKPTKKSKKKEASSFVLDDLAESEDRDVDTENDDEGDNYFGTENLPNLSEADRKRPTCSFKPEHVQSKTHFLRLRRFSHSFVNVLIGPSVPRRDVESVYDRYCRVMLLLFKPWGKGTRLRGDDESWASAFDKFLVGCPSHYKIIMDNMQLLHECKDSRDDHYLNRRSRVALAPEFTREIAGDGELAAENLDVDLIAHLESIERTSSQFISEQKGDVLRCLGAAREAGLFRVGPVSRGDLLDRVNSGCKSELVTDQNAHFEADWKEAYTKRRESWKKQTLFSDKLLDKDLVDVPAACVTVADMASHGSRPTTGLPASVHSFATPPSSDLGVDISETISAWNLNVEQARAFTIIARHSENAAKEQLRMYIGGPAGTGKSRVIKALQEFFAKRDQIRRFRLASFMGIAARNIEGATLHATLGLGRRSSKSANSKSRRDLTAMWVGVDYLFVDEVSMIGCQFLYKIHMALRDAKGNSELFGGVNVIFAGDFCQLPPVSDKKLFACLSKPNAQGGVSKRSLDVMFGKLLWLSVDSAVILEGVMRQVDVEFVKILGRLRHGCCTMEDYIKLKRRVLPCSGENVASSDWTSAPIIVSDNAVKDALNVEATIAFAARTNQKVEWYHCTDVQSGEKIISAELRERLEKLHSGQTSQRLGVLPLVLGMPVLVSQNFDVEGGVVNGSRGTLQTIRYRVDEQGFRHLTSCVVKIENSTDSAMPHLEPHLLPILEDVVEVRLKNRYTNKASVFKRTQVPIVPAFAMTAHKAQGQTMERVVIDLASCKGTEAPYVMLSRTVSLEGLVILRDFPFTKISCRLSQECREDTRRLKIVSLRTKQLHGSPQEKESSTLELARLEVSPDRVIGVSWSDVSGGDPWLVLKRVLGGGDGTDSLKKHAHRSRRVSSKSGGEFSVFFCGPVDRKRMLVRPQTGTSRKEETLVGR